MSAAEVIVLVLALAAVAVVSCCCLAYVAFRPARGAALDAGPSQWDTGQAPTPSYPSVPRTADPMPRSEAAAALGVSEKTLRRNALAWGIEQVDGHGRQAMCTVESVNARLKVLHDGTGGE